MNVVLNFASEPEQGAATIRRLPARMRLEPLPPEGQSAILLYRQLIDEQAQETVAELMRASLSAEGTLLSLSVTRPGTPYRLVFSPDTVWQTLLQTPAGALDVEVRTVSLEGMFTKEHLSARIVYELFLDGQSQGLIRLQITGHPAP